MLWSNHSLNSVNALPETKCLDEKLKKQKHNEGRLASGIEVGEKSELDKALQETVEIFDGNEKIRKAENAAKKKETWT